MVIFVKPDGTSVIENDVLGLGSYVGKIAIVSPTRTGAFVTLKVMPPSGRYMEPLYAAPMLSTDAEQLGIYLCDVAEGITSVSGRVRYQVSFEYEDGSEEITPEGTFTVSPGVVSIPPENPSRSMYEEIRAAMIASAANYAEVVQKLDTVWEAAQMVEENLFEIRMSVARAKDAAASSSAFAQTATEQATRAAHYAEEAMDSANVVGEAKNLLQKIPKLKFAIVNVLPTFDIDINTIYLERGNEDNGDIFSEHIFIPNEYPADGSYKLYTAAEGKWERIGSQQLKLDGYATENWVTNAFVQRTQLAGAINAAIADAAASGKFKPIKGVDYFTAEEIEQIVDDVVRLIPTPEIPEGGDTLPHATEQDNGSFLQVIGGAWAKAGGDIYVPTPFYIDTEGYTDDAYRRTIHLWSLRKPAEAAGIRIKSLTVKARDTVRALLCRARRSGSSAILTIQHDLGESAPNVMTGMASFMLGDGVYLEDEEPALLLVSPTQSIACQRMSNTVESGAIMISDDMIYDKAVGDTVSAYIGDWSAPPMPICSAEIESVERTTIHRFAAAISNRVTVLEESGVGGGGGSGGTGTNAARISVVNTTGWLSKTVSAGSEVEISFDWTSLEEGMPTGNGTLTVSVGGAVKLSREIKQGAQTIPLSKYLTSGTNRIMVEVADVYGNSRTLSFTVTYVSVSISSYFDGTIARTGAIPFNYTPVGAVEKVVHFLVDGAQIGTQTITASGREQTYTIPAQAHGSHTFEVYFTADIEGQPVESNHLFYDLITYEEGATEPIIAVPFNAETVVQYSTVAIPYIVYTPNMITSAVTLKDGTNTVANLTVDRTQQIWSYKALNSGVASLSIVCGDAVKPIAFAVTPNELDVSAETANLELYLTSAGRSNNEEHPLTWKSGAVEAELTGFNLTSDGWKLDEDNNTVLRVSGDARVYIPFNIFGTDFRTTGKTIEVEFATRDVLNYDATILSTWSGDRGIKITAQKATLKSEQSEIFTQYKENETVRIAFTVEKRAENRLLAIYINGIMSGVMQYPDDDDFAQSVPVGISIGSSDCTTDIYCIRVYSNNLTRYQILDNWIADTQDVEKLVERYSRNNIFDDYGNIVASKIPSYLPYMVVNVGRYADLPQSKGDKKTVSGEYIDPLNPSRSFKFDGAEIDVQGTSSQYYSRKNYKIKFKNGFIIGGVTQTGYQLRPTSMPTNEFTYKADVASSEGANNVELARLYDDTCPVKTPPQMADSRVRQGIEGYPMLMFYGSGNNLTFLGKYNFNNDKGTPEVFGFAAGDESWEILQNNTEMVIWKDDNFEGDAWKTSFEGRYPDKNTDTTRLAAFASWLKSTDTTAVSSEAEKAARLQKFKDEFGNWCNVDAMLFNYIFTETFLMVDNRAKNAFPTRYDADGKWLILPYDYDTAIGINNEGELKFGYELEDTDLANGNNVYNGQDSVLYVNMRLAFADEIMAMFKTLRSGDLFSYDEIERRFEEHQGVWGEAVFNEDARFKYIDPLVNEGNKTYLPMLQGSKAEQRKWWLYNRFRYLDSKYNAGDALEDYIMLRSYAVADITVTPYADIYATAKFDSALVQKRALRGSTYTLENPLSGGRDAVISIYSASQLSSIGDVSGLKPGMADFSKAVKLSSLKVGDSTAGYDNPNLTDLTIGNLVLLRSLDVRNCSALTQAVDISGCTNIEHVYFDGTATTGVTLPNGGILKTLHLPSTVTNLTILNQKQITDFVLPSYANISTLRIENTPIVDTMAALNAIAANSRVRLVGVDWSMETPTEVLALMDKLDTFRGLDEAGNNLDKAVVSGVIHIPALTGEQLAEMNRRYPNITIDYDALTVRVQFVNGETVVSETYVASGAAITPPEDPTKESTAQYNFTFAGWSLDGVNVVDVTVAGEENMVFYAVYTEVLRYYNIRFLNGSTVLQAGLWAYGDTPVYMGDEPTPPEEHAFNGWTPDIGMVTGDMDYVAKFKSTASVARKIADGTVTSVESNATSVGNMTFYYCTKLTSVDIPNVTSIGKSAFYNCESLASIDFQSATSVGNYAFNGCAALTSANLPNAIEVGSSAFSGCEALTSANFPKIARLETYVFQNCKSLKNAYFPNAAFIGGSTFSGCTSLENVDISNIDVINTKAFRNCSALISIRLPASPPSLPYTDAFSGINIACVFSVPTGSLGAYQSDTNWSALTSTYTFTEEDRS